MLTLVYEARVGHARRDLRRHLDLKLLPRATDLQRWFRVCKQSTVFCVRGILAGLRSAVQAVTKLFQLSGKDRAPHSEF